MTSTDIRMQHESQAAPSVCDSIDVVIPWVDGNDPQWLEQKERYDGIISPDKSSSRYRDWDNLQYLLRGIEQCWPWVHKVFVITCGHAPVWLNKDCDKLRFVTHAEFIPSEYLPTFNSNVIELNMHRIPDLGEHFIYLNDDFFPVTPMRSTDFFRKGLPCDSALQQHLLSIHVSSDDTIQYIDFTNLGLLNSNFRKNLVTRGNLMRWYGPYLGMHGMLQAVVKSSQRFFTGFFVHHSAQPFLKSSFDHVWNSVHDYLDNICHNRFRQKDDANHWLVRYWQLAENRFYPTRLNRRKSFNLPNDSLQDIVSAIRNRSYDIITINDTPLLSYSDFLIAKSEINKELAALFPHKSSFEL